MTLCGTLTENESDDRRLLLAITVEIEDGVVEYIEMKEIQLRQWLLSFAVTIIFLINLWLLLQNILSATS
jgi:hypothetical protein